MPQFSIEVGLKRVNCLRWQNNPKRILYFLHVLHHSCNTCTMSFDLWMSRKGIGTFVMILHFLNDKWEPCHVIMGYFETAETTKSSLALQMNGLLAK